MAKRELIIPELFQGCTIEEKFRDDRFDLQVVGIQNQQANIGAEVLIPNNRIPISTLIARVGARHSRSADGVAEIISKEIQDPEQLGGRLSKITSDYGHASPSDMSNYVLGLRLTMLGAYSFFNSNHTDQGQEKSTRYVEERAVKTINFVQAIGKPSYDSLKMREQNSLSSQWDVLMNQSFENYQKWITKLKPGLAEYLKGQDYTQSTINSRVLDVARSFIPLGTMTELYAPFSVRNLKNIADIRLDSHDYQNRELGRMILCSLAVGGQLPNQLSDDFSGVIKYREITNDSYLAVGQVIDFIHERFGNIDSKYNIPNQQQYTSKVILSPNDQSGLLHNLFMLSYPNVNIDIRNELIDSLKDDELVQIGRLLQYFDHHNFFPSEGDFRGLGVEYLGPVAYQRDFNRHRAFGRYSTILSPNISFSEIISCGYITNPVLAGSEFWSGLVSEWNMDNDRLYEQIFDFYGDVNNYLPGVDQYFMRYLLPLGHSDRVVYTAPLNQWKYFAALRTAPGGDMGYRMATHEMVDSLISADVLLASIFGSLRKPDMNSIQEIISRS